MITQRDLSILESFLAIDEDRCIFADATALVSPLTFWDTSLVPCDELKLTTLRMVTVCLLNYSLIFIKQVSRRQFKHIINKFEPAYFQ